MEEKVPQGRRRYWQTHVAIPVQRVVCSNTCPGAHCPRMSTQKWLGSSEKCMPRRRIVQRCSIVLSLSWRSCERCHLERVEGKEGVYWSWWARWVRCRYKWGCWSTSRWLWCRQIGVSRCLALDLYHLLAQVSFGQFGGSLRLDLEYILIQMRAVNVTNSIYIERCQPASHYFLLAFSRFLPMSSLSQNRQAPVARYSMAFWMLFELPQLLWRVQRGKLCHIWSKMIDLDASIHKCML